MSRLVYRYVFPESVPVEDIESSIVLAIFGVEALHGEAQVRLDAAHFLDEAERKCVIDASTPVGRDLNRLFAGLMLREFGENAFRVTRIQHADEPKPTERDCNSNGDV